MAKEGSTVSGLMDSFATTVSVALQYGVPLRDLVNKFAHVRFEPSGFTGNQEIPIAKSIIDYIFRWLGSRFLSDDEKATLGLIDRAAIVSEAPAGFGGGLSFGGGSSTPPSSAAPDSPAAETSADTQAIASPEAVAEPAPDASSKAGEAAAGPPTATALASPSIEEPAPVAGEARSPLDLPVVATNGHANGHTKAGNGEASRSPRPARSP